MKAVLLLLNIRLIKAIYIAEGGQLAVGVALLGTRGRGLWFLSPNVYDVSGGSCALGERSLFFQI